MAANLEGIMNSVKQLSPAEVHELRAKIDELIANDAPLMTEDEFENYLAAKGVISLPDRNASGDFGDFKPIEIKGKPLSETIIEERR